MKYETEQGQKEEAKGYIYLHLINHDPTRGMTIKYKGDSSGSPSNDSDLSMLSHNNPTVECCQIDGYNFEKLK